MYRKKFDPQRGTLPDNYRGWAASENTDPLPCDIAAQNTHTEPAEHTPNIPSAGSESTAAITAIPHAVPSNKDLNDIILIGAVLLLLFRNTDKPKDPSLILPLILLLLKK